MDPRAVLDSLGPFFSVEERDGRSWQPLVKFCADPPAVERRVAAIAGRLGLDDRDPAALRIAGSVAQLGMTTRIVSPLVALALLDRRAGNLWWVPDDTSMYAVSVDEGMTPAADALIDIAARISSAHKESCPSDVVRAGNVTSAISGAAALIGRQAPTLASRCADLADKLARRTGDTSYDGGAGTPTFRRRSCCLLYKATESLCPDCVLNPPAPVE